MDVNKIKSIAAKMEKDITDTLNRCGMMFRIFSRVKTERSIKHKFDVEPENFLSGKRKVQDVIGFRIVVYFPDDVDVLSFYYDTNKLVKRSVDDLGTSTFRPQRLNLTHSLPEEYIEEYRKALPEEYKPYIDNTYEIQIRTIFSEGWHEVEHDLRYKCKEDWVGYNSYSRTLNGVIATLETAEWSMKSLFHEMAFENMMHGHFRAMLRNKMRIRLKDDNFSAPVEAFLKSNRDVSRRFMETNRVVFVLMLCSHKGNIKLTYDNVLFLVNRIDIFNDELSALESEETKAILDAFIAS